MLEQFDWYKKIGLKYNLDNKPKIICCYKGTIYIYNTKLVIYCKEKKQTCPSCEFKFELRTSALISELSS